MLRRGLFIFAAAAILCSLSSCENKEIKKESKPVLEKKKPSINTDEMVFVPAGSFIFGTNSRDSRSQVATPQQKLSLNAFWIDKYEVTNKQFLSFSVKSKYISEGPWRDMFATSDQAFHPVANITWRDANKYCQSVGKRLPTEEEWEKAARGPDGNGYPWGNEWKEKRSNTKDAGLQKPTKVGEFDDVSFYGAHDMLGNVQEWTASRYAMYKGSSLKITEKETEYRVARGLGFYHMGRDGHLWDRTATFANSLYGFGCRCIRDATREEIAAQASKPK
jgi:formylglycine-generating enzyme required for sulfatase activity